MGTILTNTSLQKLHLSYGNSFVELEYDATNQWVVADWIGVHSLGTIKQGMEELLKLIKERKCEKYLNINTRTIGGWETSHGYLAESWAPRAVAEGLKYAAHVMAPGLMARQSAIELQPLVIDTIAFHLFFDLEKARTWLRQQG